MQMNNIGQDIISNMMGSLGTDQRDFNSCQPKDADASSQETQESSQSSPADAVLQLQPEQAPGFDLLRRARAWVDARKLPAEGGGNKTNQDFLNV